MVCFVGNSNFSMFPSARPPGRTGSAIFILIAIVNRHGEGDFDHVCDSGVAGSAYLRLSATINDFDDDDAAKVTAEVIWAVDDVDEEFVEVRKSTPTSSFPIPVFVFYFTYADVGNNKLYQTNAKMNVTYAKTGVVAEHQKGFRVMTTTDGCDTIDAIAPTEAGSDGASATSFRGNLQNFIYYVLLPSVISIFASTASWL